MGEKSIFLSGIYLSNLKSWTCTSKILQNQCLLNLTLDRKHEIIWSWLIVDIWLWLIQNIYNESQRELNQILSASSNE